jgi:hypothetical protein
VAKERAEPGPTVKARKLRQIKGTQLLAMVTRVATRALIA